MTSKARNIADLGSNDVIETTSTGVDVTGDVSLGDNGKVKLGASDDLQIYHDGNDSLIKDIGTGNLTLTGSAEVTIENADRSQYMVRATDGGNVKLYNAGSEKLATTSTGVDVTGTITADGIQTDTSNTNFNLLARNSTNVSTYIQNGGSGDILQARAGSMDAGQGRLQFSVANNGDVSFYEDTGTTAKMVWDASAENLNITGQKDSTSLTLSAPLVTVGGGTLADYNQIYFDNTSGVGDAYIRHWANAHNDGKSALSFGTSETGTVTERMRIDSSGLVSIKNEAAPTLRLENTDTSLVYDQIIGDIDFYQTDPSVEGVGVVSRIRSINESSFKGNAALAFHTGNASSLTERARIDSSGNLLVGKTSENFGVQGIQLKPTGASITNDNQVVFALNRLSTDGSILNFHKDGSAVGSIGSGGSFFHISGGSAGGTHAGLRFINNQSVRPCTSAGSNLDNTLNLGANTARFNDIYATNGTIQTSDRNEKQDIAELSDAEQRVAKTCKGLLRKFRWKDAVEEKGDEARIHFGIIAQDLQDAFTAEGLDAGRYAMFISSTWTDEETGEERTRLGVRYPELLAFIIATL